MEKKLKRMDQEYEQRPRLRLAGDGIPPDSVDAFQYARESIGRSLKAAREKAGLQPEELAGRMVSFPFFDEYDVAGVEMGRYNVSEAFVRAWLRACGLPEDWRP